MLCFHCDATGIEPFETSCYPPEPCSMCKGTKKVYKYTFHIITNPPMYEILLGISKVEWKVVTEYGTTREDAAKRAGIEG